MAVYRGKGKLLSIGDKLSFRNLAEEERALIKHRIISLVPRYRIFRDGKLRAEVNKKLLSVFRDKFKVDMKDDSPDLEIVGNIFDHKHRFLRGDNEVAHVQTVTVVIGYYVVQWNARLLVEFAVIAITSLVVTILLYDLVIKRTSMTHFLFGMRPKKEMAKETKPAVA